MRRAAIATVLVAAVLVGGLGAVADLGGQDRAAVDPIAPAEAQSATTVCETDDELEAWAHIITMNYADCFGIPDDPSLNGSDAEETKINIYDSAAQSAQSQEVFLDSADNSLGNLRTIALMEGKNAYIRALNNGSTEPTARSMAKDAVDEFYAKYQVQLGNHWNVSVRSLDNYIATAEDTTGINYGSDPSFIQVDTWSSAESSSWPELWTPSQASTTDVLTNGTEIQSTPIRLVWTAHPAYTTSVSTGVRSGSGTTPHGSGIKIAPPSSNYDKLLYMDFQVWNSTWHAYEAQNAAVNAEIDTFVTDTYDQWEAGKINESDLIDPYLCSRDYGPSEDYQSWAMCSATTMGLNSPENLSQYGYMEVVSGGQVLEGQLLSDGLPSEGGFAVGSTYNASQISGIQAVVTANSMETLDGTFTLRNATTADGEQVNQTEVISYRDVTYETTSLDGYAELMNQLQEDRSEIEAWQQALRSAGGGGGGLFGTGISLGFFEWIAVFIVVFLVVAVVIAS